MPPPCGFYQTDEKKTQPASQPSPPRPDRPHNGCNLNRCRPAPPTSSFTPPRSTRVRRSRSRHARPTAQLARYWPNCRGDAGLEPPSIRAKLVAGRRAEPERLSPLPPSPTPGQCRPCVVAHVMPQASSGACRRAGIANGLLTELATTGGHGATRDGWQTATRLLTGHLGGRTNMRRTPP